MYARRDGAIARARALVRAATGAGGVHGCVCGGEGVSMGGKSCPGGRELVGSIAAAAACRIHGRPCGLLPHLLTCFTPKKKKEKKTTTNKYFIFFFVK